MRWLFLILALALAACSPSDPEAAREAQFRRDMAQAAQQARAQLPFFWAAYDAPAETEYDFLLKVAFPAQGGTEKDEQLWVADVAREGDQLTGAMSTAPQFQGAVKRGDIVTFTEKQIVDWAFFRGEELLGHYTTRVMLPRLPQDQAEAMSSMFGENPQ